MKSISAQPDSSSLPGAPSGETVVSRKTAPPSRQRIHLLFDPESMPLLQRLPWHKPLTKWTKRDAQFLTIRSGLSRHVVRFMSIKGQAFAIKETAAPVAEKELRSYERLRDLGIPTLLPVGMAVRDDGVIPVDTPLGQQFVENSVGYLVTSLLEYSLPNYHLFKRSFTRENRRRIWDAIVTLFVELHCRSVYWGDATLSNMMIVFAKQHFPEIGVRTVLKAVLADAETVEFPPAMSRRLRLADVEYFLESMQWTEADMKASRLISGEVMTSDDQQYILRRYQDLYDIEHEEQSFELITRMDVDALLGPFEQKGHARALLKHIYEHKWYLSEQENREIPVDAAAQDWYVNVFKPVMQLFTKLDILEEFPESTASSLYLDVMLRKYYLSEQQGRDVGIIGAFEDYARELSRTEQARSKLSRLARSIRQMFGGRII